MNKLKPLLRELSKSSTLIHVLAIALPLFALASQVWGVRFTTADDAFFALQTQPSERLALAWDMAKQSGRVLFLYYMPFLYFCISHWQTPLYDLLQYGSFAIAYLLVTYVLSLYVSRRFAYVFALFYITTLTLQWDHTLITSNPLFLHVHTSIFCASLLLLRRYALNRRNLWRYLSLCLLALSVIGIEFQAIVLPTVYILAARAVLLSGQEHPDEQNRRALKRLSLGASAVAGAYLLIYVAWRLYLGSQYEGVTPNLNSFDFRSAIGIVAMWSLSGNIFFDWIVAPGVPFISNDLVAVSGRLQIVPISLWTNIPWYGFAIGLLATVSLTILFNQDRSAARIVGPGHRFWRWLPLPFLIVAFVPSVLLSVTTKYQHWFSLGVNSYAYTSISAYGIAMLFSWAVFSLLSVAKTFKFAVQAAVCALLGLGAVTTAAHNAQVAPTMRDSAARWWAVDMLMTSSLRAMVDKSVIVAPRLESFYWSVPADGAYWEQLARAAFGVTVEVKDDLSSVDWERAKSAFYFDFFRSERTDEVSILLVPLSRSDNGIQISREIWVAAKGPLLADLVGRGVSGRRFAIDAPFLERVSKRGVTVYRATLPEQADPADLTFEDRLMWAPLNANSRKAYLFGEPIDFSAAGNSAIFKADGWSVQEHKHTWAIGAESNLTIWPSKEARCNLVGELDVSGFVPPGFSRQPFEVAVNGHRVWSGSVAERTKVRFEIPLAIWIGDRPVRVRFSHPNGVSPASTIGGDDVRVLAVDFFQFQVTDCVASR